MIAGDDDGLPDIERADAAISEATRDVAAIALGGIDPAERSLARENLLGASSCGATRWKPSCSKIRASPDSR